MVTVLVTHGLLTALLGMQSTFVKVNNSKNTRKFWYKNVRLNANILIKPNFSSACQGYGGEN